MHALSDGKIARAIRTGVLHDGRLSVLMNGFGKIGDRDVAAILGYMRSRPPVFEPTPHEAVQPRTKLTLTGAMILTYVAKIGVDRPLTVPVPEKAPDVAYGRYMTEVLDCGGCHTDGFESDKSTGPKAFAGGFELTEPATGLKIYTKNITPDDETGIGRWSVDDFERAIAGGVAPNGHVIRKPMPQFARLDHTDATAIYTYLRTVPKVHRPNTPGGSPLEKAGAGDSPEVLFTKLGCVSCHGDGAPHRDKIAGAIGKSDDEVAAWILDPQAKKPGAAMPSFKSMIDRDQATSLARYARSLASTRLASAPKNTTTPL